MLLRIPLVFLLILLLIGTRSSSHVEANEREIVDDQSDGTVSCVDVG